jgi:hypothetical protein
MIRYLIAALLLITTLPIHAISKYKVGDTLTVFAEYGLKLRNAPNKDSATIKVLPFGKRVVIGSHSFKTVAHSDNFLGIHTINGFWVQVAVDSITGYVFDGYLSSLPTPVLFSQEYYNQTDYSTEEAYLNKYFKKTGSLFDIIKLPDDYTTNKEAQSPSVLYQQYSQKFERGITYSYYHHLEVGGTYLLTFEQHSIEEILLLAKIIADYPKINPVKYLYDGVAKKFILGVIDDVGCTIEISIKNAIIYWEEHCGC